MFKNMGLRLLSSTPESLGKTFRRLGWTGFWLQVVLGTLPIILLIYVLFFCPSAAVQRRGLGIGEYMALVALLVLLFTIFWSYRYTRLGRKMADPAQRPAASLVTQVLWTGLAASLVGIFLSLLLMTFEVGRLLFVFLRAPQGGMPVIQTQTYDPATWVSAIDMAGLLAELSVLAAELLVLTFSLWLLFKLTLSETKYETAGAKVGESESSAPAEA